MNDRWSRLTYREAWAFRVVRESADVLMLRGLMAECPGQMDEHR